MQSNFPTVPIHHKYSPSRLQQLKECPGSARMQEGLPEVRTPEADEGTMLHERVATRNLAGLTTEQETLVRECLAFVDGLIAKGGEGVQVFYEVRLEIKRVDGKVLTYGTADVVILYPDGTAKVVDWKFGRTPVTEAARNLQLASYAVGVMQKYNVSAVEVIVFQPRIHAVTSYTFTKPANILHNIGLVIAAAEDDRLVLNAGDACRYCTAKAICPAFRAKFSALDGSEKRDLTDPAILLEYWEKSKVVERFIKEVKEAVEAYVEENGELGGWKFKEKPGNREITDVPGLAEKLSELLTAREFASACKVSVTGIIDQIVQKTVAAATAEGIKLTKTDAKKNAEAMLSEFIRRGKPTRTLVKE